MSYVSNSSIHFKKNNRCIRIVKTNIILYKYLQLITYAISGNMKLTSDRSEALV